MPAVWIQALHEVLHQVAALASRLLFRRRVSMRFTVSPRMLRISSIRQGVTGIGPMCSSHALSIAYGSEPKEILAGAGSRFVGPAALSWKMLVSTDVVTNKYEHRQ